MGDEGPKVTRPDSGVGDVAQYYSMHEYGYDYGTAWYGLVWYGMVMVSLWIWLWIWLDW